MLMSTFAVLTTSTNDNFVPAETDFRKGLVVGDPPKTVEAASGFDELGTILEELSLGTSDDSWNLIALEWLGCDWLGLVESEVLTTVLLDTSFLCVDSELGSDAVG